MNIYLLELVGKWISFLFVSLVSFFGGISLNESNLVSSNSNNLKSLSIINEVVPYKTINQFQSNIPSNVKRIVTKGVNGIMYTNTSGEMEMFRDVTNEVIEYGNAPIGNYSGKMTGYGPDCKTCNGKGFVGCPAPGRIYHNLVTDGEIFKDSEYGDVRILAAAKDEFPCGTIVEVTNKGQIFYGIVLDRGAAMENAYKEGRIVIDLAFKSEVSDIKEIRSITNSNVQYNVKRWGF